MYLRGCIYGIKSRVACSRIIPRYRLSPRPPCASGLRQAFSLRSDIANQWISHRHSHVVAAEVEDKNKQDTDPELAIRRVKSNVPYATPSLRFITFDQDQHDKAEPGERVAGFLPVQFALSPKQKRLQRYAFGKNKADKLFVNKMLKDKGLQSYDWRIALSDLQKHYTPEKINEPKDIDTSVLLPNLTQNPGSHTQGSDSSNEIQNPVRKVTTRSRNYRSFRLARNISPPIEWSQSNLAVYVEALAESQRTQARVAWAEKPRLKGWANIEDVVAAFDKVFYSTASQQSLSIEACNTALRFYYDHGMMAKARSLYIRMEDLKMHISTETFNILLRGSASRRDLHNFTFLLNNLTRRGFKPNEKTWTLFLQVVDPSKVRAVIARKMAELNMLDKIGIRRDVAAHMLQYEIVNYLGNGHDQRSFLDYMNSKYGIGWLSTTAGNQLLNEVAKLKSPAESLDLLYEMNQAGFMPNDISINTLLRHCLPLRGHELAIEILDAFKHHYRLHPGPESYETLLLQAWRSRLLNLSTVIWRSACIYGAVTDKMESLVFQSLLSYTIAQDKRIQSDNIAKTSNPSRYAKFKNYAARCVIGLDGPREARLNQAVNILQLDPRTRTLKLAQDLLESSLRVSRTCLLKSNFTQLLRQALTMDKIWAAECSYKKDGWREKFPRTIAVYVKFKRRHQRRFALRLGKRVVRGRSRLRLLSRKRRLLRGPNHRKPPQSNTDQRTANYLQRIKNLRTARPPMKSRQRTSPTRSTSASALSRVWRFSSTQQFPRPRLRLRSSPSSTTKRKSLNRRVLVASSAISWPLPTRNQKKRCLRLLRPPRFEDRALVSSVSS